MNTATYREIARNAEAVQDYARAAAMYDRAADVYPCASFTQPGTLAERDIAVLRQQAENCRAAVRS